MARYTVKVAKSGQKIAVFCDGKFQRHILAGQETFEPANAVKFAEKLFDEMNKEASQMTDPAAEPSITTKAEEQKVSVPESEADAKGTAVNEHMASLQEENRQLKAKIAKQQYESQVERKARRGLAIAKEEVAQGKVANSQESVEARVMDITAMSDDQIEILERRTAGLDPFESEENAQKYASRMRIASRMYRKAAEDAMEDKDEEEAIKSEKQADICDAEYKMAQEFIAYSKKKSVDEEEMDEDESQELEAKKAKKKKAEDVEIEVETEGEEDESEAEGEAQEMEAKKAKKKKAEDVEIEVETDEEEESEESEEKSPEVEAKKKASSEDDQAMDMEMGDKKASDEFAPEDIEKKVDEQATGEAPHMPNYHTSNELISLYEKVAEINERIAKKAMEDGEEEVAEEADLEAKESKKKASILREAKEDDVEEKEEMDKEALAKELSDSYTRLATIHSTIATQAEAEGKDDVADEADVEAADCKKKAELLMSAKSDEEEGIENTAEADKEEMEKESAQEMSEEEPEESEEKKASQNAVRKIASVEANKVAAADNSVNNLSADLWGSKYADLK